MQLASVLVVIVATLTLLMGITVLFGSKINKKALSIWFFVAVAGASLWAYSVTVFLNLPEGAVAIAPWITAVMYISALIMAGGMVGFAAKFTDFKKGRTLAISLAAVGAAFCIAIIAVPDLLYTNITLSELYGNVVNLRLGWFYFAYIFYFVVTIVAYGMLLLTKLMSRPPTLVKNTILVLLVGPGVCALTAFCFGLIVPLNGYDLIWIGPLSIGVAVMAFYYAILRYRLILIQTVWLKMLSYATLIATMSLAYVVLLFVLSILLFRHSYLSLESLILNFIMTATLLLIMPWLSELMENVRSLLSINVVDVGYIVKRLNRFRAGKVNLEELTVFLADHLHFSYIGIAIGDKLYGSKEVEFGAKDIEIGAIENKSAPDQIWQILKNKEGDRILEFEELRAIVDLRDVDGQTFGRIIFGAPHREGQFGEEDFSQLEMIIGLVALAVNPKKGRRAS
ncbi:hypothetical protein FWF89_00495 [Candidatus Saccharibacteria bacterium]|nr:hypothetical protein [Candidatus Saccharibacteria bacterium]